MTKYCNSLNLLVLALAQVFGVLPITGIFSRNIKNIKFKFLSFRTFHTSLWLVGAFIFQILEVHRMAYEEKINAKSIGGIAFYCVAIASCVTFFRVAAKWNELLYSFEHIEAIFSKSCYTLSGWSLRKQINCATCLMMTFGAIEHSLSWFSFVYDRIIQAEICKWEIGSWFFYLATLHLVQIYKFLPVNVFTVIWAEYMNISFTFTWNFIDLFIMIMSFSIASKFKMINERLEHFKGKVVLDEFWDEVRYHYNKICELNERVDNILGSLICIACLSDLYYVCLQLLNVATPLPFLVNKIYFWYSTVFLICRTSAMFLISASINEESIKPLSVFRTIPSNGWTQEVQRFCNQIQNNGVALSGKNFFFLTRSIVISIAGTILTYELVLLQFDGEKIVSIMFDPCETIANNSAIQPLIQN
ncbi:hypothetical protein ACKWTF_009883 [Chironomus riparius]